MIIIIVIFVVVVVIVVIIGIYSSACFNRLNKRRKKNGLALSDSTKLVSWGFVNTN